MVDTMDEAAAFLKNKTGTILAATGSKEAGILVREGLQDRVFLRMLPLEENLRTCLALGFSAKNLICMQGPFSEELNRALLHQTGASWLLTKESGEGSGFVEKLSAAAKEGAGLVVIRRPKEAEAYTMNDILGIILTGELGKTINGELPKDKQEASEGKREVPEGELPKAAKLRWFPFFQNISGKKALVVGGGNIALRRIKILLRFDCSIEVIAPALHAELAELAAVNPKAITFTRRSFESGDCRADIVLAATNDREVNHRIVLECMEKRIPVSAADCKEESSFFFPAVIVSDKIVAGVSSGGEDHPMTARAAKLIRLALEKGGMRSDK
jgi:precorrin-2 dehydrogenase/sirohydrochlorin ferrochelatase/precorrin-6A/cobalt-precorrin-6A reductase